MWADRPHQAITVGIIIPAYNAEKHICECLNSLINQTIQPDQVIIVDDGSTDNTSMIVHEYKEKYPIITYIYQENQGQGMARNMALGISGSTHVMFLDSDDFIHEQTLARCIEWIEKEDPDLVHFEHRKLYEDGVITYPKENRFFDGISVAEGETCEGILNNSTYYTCNNLFRRSFLVKHGIRYGRGVFVEDYVFLAKVGIHARKICFIHAPLYTYRIHSASSSRASRKTRVHFEGFLAGTEDCLRAAQENNTSNKARAYLINHKIRAYTYVYFGKTQRKHRKEFLIRLYECFLPYEWQDLQFLSISAKKFIGDGKPLSYRKYLYLLYLTYQIELRRRLQKYPGLKRIYRLFHSKDWRIATIIGAIKKSIERLIESRVEKICSTRPILDKTMAIVGIDGLWKGNGRYLYTMLQNNYPNWNVVFLYNKGAKIPTEVNAVKKNSLRGKSLISRSKVLFVESWEKIPKRNDRIVIQLWHGTPMKKMLFDTAEPFIMKKNPYHRSTQYKQIQSWDYFVCDSKKAKDYFNSCFLIEDNKILASGYPRVKYLLDNSTNTELREKTRVSLGITTNEKLISYFPTWRDYVSDAPSDNNYLLNTDVFLKYLNDKEKCKLFYSEHSYSMESKKELKGEHDTQDYILASDWIVSDYSSVIFDAIAINTPIALLMKDCEKYQETRGLYQDILDDLAFCTAENEIGLAKILNNPPDFEKYQYIREKYCQLSGKFSLIEDLERILEVRANQP